jgi:CubicO group peptidase (beta-lactamase class C family)
VKEAIRMARAIMGGRAVHGFTAPGFEPVRDEFARNFAERGEVGAACAVHHKGRLVVDLWGGWRDPATEAPWEEDTLVHVFSTTKGVAALTVALAVSRGLFGFDDRIAEHWPEFAQHGKEAITVRTLLAFQAGLCAVDRRLDAALVADPDRLAAVLAAQRPAWPPGEYHGYHLHTADWIASELLRRTDPAGRTIGAYLRDELAGPLGAEFRIGTPASVPDERFAVVQEFPLTRLALHPRSMPWPFVLALAVPGSLARRVMFNLDLRTPAQMGLPPWRALELPGANGIGQVRALATMYGEFATGGRRLGLDPAVLAALREPASPPRRGPRDRVLRTDMVYTLGFTKPFPGHPFSPSPGAFGAAGTGGSNAFADPDAQLGFAYAPNRLGLHQFGDPREAALRQATYRCLG